MRQVRGLSLIELLVAALIMSMAIGVVARSFSAGLTFEDKSAGHRASTVQRLWLEDQLTKLISGASLKGSIAYFVAPIPTSVNTPAPAPTPTPATTPTPGATQPTPLGDGANSLVLTNLSLPLPNRVLISKAPDFETLNKQYGPIGGTWEIGLSMTPVGDPKNQTGLFLRLQCPADTDMQQGGTESLLGRDVQDVRFQFYDGSQWQNSWDSQGANKGALPSLVRVRYQLAGESGSRELLIRLPLSTVSSTSQNPTSNPPAPLTPGAPLGSPPSSSPTGSAPTSSSPLGGSQP